MTSGPSRIASVSALALTLSLAMGLAGCAKPHPSASPTPTPATPGRKPAVTPVAAGLPAVPVVRGAPIAIKLQYPADNQLITARDSNFVFGAVGSGDVTLTINGTPVQVAPNGAFLTWLPTAAATASYELVAVRGADTVRRTVKVRYPAQRAPLYETGPLRVDTSSLAPGKGWWAQADELIRVSIRAPRNARVMLVGSDGVSRVFPDTSAPAGSDQAPAGASTAPDDADVGKTFTTDIAARLLADSVRPARIIVTRQRVSQSSGPSERTRQQARDSVSMPIPLVKLMPRDTRTLARLISRNSVGSDTDKVIYARTIVDGTYKWMLLPGTVLEVTGSRQGFMRVRLDETLDVWVDSNDLALLPEGTALPRRVTGGFRVLPDKEWVDLIIGTGERPAFLVESESHALKLTLYGVQANPAISPIIGNDTLIQKISWDQLSNDRVQLKLSLSEPAFGWLALWDNARGSLVLRVRRTPKIDVNNPLRGITIAVDPGHPPIGATGPTGLYEGDAVFPVGMKLVDMLKERGANAFSTRTSLAPLGLTERSVAARRADAHLFVSIHLNGLPDGVNPYTNNGTSTLFFHNASEPLARFIQQELMKRFGLRDLGVHYQNLAVARPTWYPSALAEGLFLMIPEQESAMRDEEFQKKYAQGLLVGIERYLRWLGSGGR